MRVDLIGGPYGGASVELKRQPEYILVGDWFYMRLDDRETGEFLDGYQFDA